MNDELHQINWDSDPRSSGVVSRCVSVCSGIINCPCPLYLTSGSEAAWMISSGPEYQVSFPHWSTFLSPQPLAQY